MSLPLITAGLVCYNAENSLESAFSSMVSQTWENLEIVIVDDCSTDNTWEILQKFSAENPNVRIFRNERNGGVGAARRRLIEESRGDFVAFFDGDDRSSDERITKQYLRITEYETSHPSTDLVICHVSRRVSDDFGNEWSVPAMGINEGLVPHGLAVADSILLWEQTPFVCGSIGTGVQMARRDAYVNAGNFDPEFRRCEDTELAVRWAFMGAHFVGVKDELMTQDFNVTKRKIELDEIYTLKMFDKYKEYLRSHNYDRFMPLWIKAKYAYLSSRKLEFGKNIVAAFLASPFLTIRKILSALKMAHYNKMIQSTLKRYYFYSS